MARPRPHPLARSTRIDRLNSWLEAAWRRGMSPRPSLDPEVLWDKALRDASADGEIGPRSAEDIEDFRLRLEVLTQSLLEEAQLNPLGLTMAHGQLARVVRHRLMLGDLWDNQPHLCAAPIAAPIIVVGQMRSGTTRVHRLLAADPAHASTRFCDSWHPVPRKPDMRPAWSALSLSLARVLDPWLDTLHPFGATRPDEELGWLAAALNHSTYESQWRIPTYTGFSEGRDPAPIYHEFARILRTDAHWQGNSSLPRVLKVPQFAEDLPALLAQFPDARVVLTRRDERDLAASAASLVANQMTIQSDHVEMAWLVQECRRKIGLRQSRIERALANFSGPIATVEFDDLAGDWQGEMVRVYRELGLELREWALAAMQDEQHRSRRSHHQHHGSQYRAFERV
jgi:hypothetical protein